MRIFLKLAPEHSPTHRSRIIYAFRLFCAIYGHKPLLKVEEEPSADVQISYSSNGLQGSQRVLQLSNLYSARSPLIRAPSPKDFDRDGGKTVLFYAPRRDAHPDWLGEIFEWVSCADEYSCRSRDVAGRIPFSESYIGRHNLDPCEPYAAIAMRFLQRAVCQLVPESAIETVCPSTSATHFVINTHDVDFLPVAYWDSMRRLAKNSIISLLLYRAPMLALKQAKKAIKAAMDGQNVPNQVLSLAEEETYRGINSTFFFLTESCHRRDGNYRLSDSTVIRLIRLLEQKHMEIGVHGSYTSMDEPSQLCREFNRLRQCGFSPKGNRQHWLRFSLDRMIVALEEAGALYDTSLGWPNVAGFRAGACFAFPPYFFDRERPAVFLEIPLILMDHHLLRKGAGRYARAMRLLSVSKRYGWGGVSLLWHPTAFGGGQLPDEVGSVFWRLVDDDQNSSDTWVSALEFYQRVCQRYKEVGLLS